MQTIFFEELRGSQKGKERDRERREIKLELSSSSQCSFLKMFPRDSTSEYYSMVILYFLRPGRVFIQIIFSLCKSSFPLPVCILAHSFVLCGLARGPSSAGSLENFVDPFYYSARRTARHVCVEKIIKCGKQGGGRKYTARKEPLHDSEGTSSIGKDEENFFA